MGKLESRQYIVAMLLVASVARAEMPPQLREKADLVVTGKVTKLVAGANQLDGGNESGPSRRTEHLDFDLIRENRRADGNGPVAA